MIRIGTRRPSTASTTSPVSELRPLPNPSRVPGTSSISVGVVMNHLFGPVKNFYTLFLFSCFPRFCPPKIWQKVAFLIMPQTQQQADVHCLKRAFYTPKSCIREVTRKCRLSDTPEGLRETISIALRTFSHVKGAGVTQQRKIHRSRMNLIKLAVQKLSKIKSTSTLLAVLFLLFVTAGCETWESQKGPQPTIAAENDAPDTSVALREGDAVKLTFPGASRLDTAQVIRRDGRIVIPALGELDAAGKTPQELEKEIIAKYGPQLVTKEVTVTLESSTYGVFVNGAVVRPGKILSNKPLTALEAIMEAGGFDYAKANLKNVRVIRTEGSDVKTFTLDFRDILKGKATKPFYLKPSDILYVSERFTLF
jgi:polysaccharide export outer membrane protein